MIGQGLLGLQMRAKRVVRCLGLSACIALASDDAAHAAKPEAKHFAYVGDAVNLINYLKASSSKAKDNSKDIVDTACKMLTQLVSDEQFLSIIRKVGSGRISKEQKNLLISLGSVNDTVDKESQAIQDIGVDQPSSIQVMAAAIPLAKTINPENYSSDALLKDITALQQKSCSLVGQIQDSELWAKRERAVLLGVSGAVVVLADGAAEYYSWGLADLLVKFSLAVGGGMVGNALHDLSSS